MIVSVLNFFSLNAAKDVSMLDVSDFSPASWALICMFGHPFVDALEAILVVAAIKACLFVLLYQCHAD